MTLRQNNYALRNLKYEKIGEKVVREENYTYVMDEYKQEQKPAYLLQVIASAMHEYSVNRETGEREKDSLDNKIYLINVQLPKKYSKARMRIILNKDPIRLNAIFIIDPHYPESYYSLTKMIDIVNFS